MTAAFPEVGRSTPENSPWTSGLPNVTVRELLPQGRSKWVKCYSISIEQVEVQPNVCLLTNPQCRHDLIDGQVA